MYYEKKENNPITVHASGWWFGAFRSVHKHHLTQGSPLVHGQTAVWTLAQAPTLTKLRPSGVDDGVCVRGPQSAPGLMAHSVDSQDSACSHTHGRALSQQSKISKGEKVHGARSLKTKPRLQRVLSVEPHRIHIPPAPVVTGPGNAAHQGRSPEPGSSGYLSEGQSRRHRQPSTCQNSKSQKESPGVQHKPTVHINSSGTWATLISSESGWELSGNYSLQTPSQGPICPFKRLQPDLLCELFPIQRHNTSWSLSSNPAIDLKSWLFKRKQTS